MIKWQLDPRFHTPGWEERRLKELAEKKYESPMSSNTLTNADGTPYQAGYDEKTLGQVAYEAFSQSETYKRMMQQRFGYALTGPRWDQLIPPEQEVWEEVARAVLVHKEMSSQ